MSPEERARFYMAGRLDLNPAEYDVYVEIQRLAIAEEREACVKILENGVANTPEWYRLRKFIDAIRQRP